MLFTKNSVYYSGYKKLARAAVSPQYKDIFNKTPNIVGLPEEHREINTFPRSADQWELAMERPMSYYNQLPPHVYSRRVMDMTVISRDCLEIARRPCPRSSPVHCEVKLLLHLFDEEKQSTNPKPPAYSYIGLSKLSCLGCFNFLLTFNEVLGTRFVTKGTHSKAYFHGDFLRAVSKMTSSLINFTCGLQAIWSRGTTDMSQKTFHLPRTPQPSLTSHRVIL